jgi:hypothetical protein
MLGIFLLMLLGGAQQDGTLIITAQTEAGGPVAQVEILAARQGATTDDQGHATLQLPAGVVEVHLERYGFGSKNVRATITAGEAARLTVELEPQSVVN